MAVIFAANHRDHRRLESKSARIVAQQKTETKQQMAAAADELEFYRDSHDEQLPSIIASNMLVIKHVDSWGESLRFDGHGDHALIRSAGPDKKFESNDDVTVRLEGKTESGNQLLPM